MTPHQPRDTVSRYIDDRPMYVAGKPELREELASRLREYIPTRRGVLADEEVSLFSDEITINCAPLV